ncbi:hypothetical protein GCM10020001_029090 [Nonomuraea salmonea]
MGVAGVVHDQVGDDPHAAFVRLINQSYEVPEIAELGQDLHEVRDVVTAVTQRRVVERQQPEAVDAQPLQVVELADEAPDVAGPVAVGVGETPDQDLVEDRALVPMGIARFFSSSKVLGMGVELMSRLAEGS